MIDLQLSDPAMNDAMLRRYPDAVLLINACERSMALGAELVENAHDAGVLSEDFTPDDLMTVLWMAGMASHDPAAPTAGVASSIAASPPPGPRSSRDQIPRRT